MICGNPWHCRWHQFTNWRERMSEANERQLRFLTLAVLHRILKLCDALKKPLDGRSCPSPKSPPAQTAHDESNLQHTDSVRDHQANNIGDNCSLRSLCSRESIPAVYFHFLPLNFLAGTRAPFGPFALFDPFNFRLHSSLYIFASCALLNWRADLPHRAAIFATAVALRVNRSATTRTPFPPRISQRDFLRSPHENPLQDRASLMIPTGTQLTEMARSCPNF